ncbi:acyl-CoA dehydrogenase family protein [Pseudonocardia xishanensis]|uniref:Acyl-CoA dehydrogenase n=1 Tax=Pseudonocardia xishanensis TaxID=630995 RepID=A0ABP8RUR9_9PSEU
MNSDLLRLVDEVVEDHAAESPGSLWDTFVELGLTRIGVPEEVGGSGGGPSDLHTIVRRLAHHGVEVPLVEAAVAAWALPEEQDDLDPMLAHCRPPGDVLVVVSPGARVGSRVLLVEAGTGVLARVVRTQPGPPPTADLEIDEAPVVDAERVRPVETRLLAANAARLVGAATGAYELTRDYVRVREQFGKPLVALPAVAAHLARMRTALEVAGAGLDRAELQLDAGQDAWAAAAGAAIGARRAADLVVSTSHQLHGAMGMTEEYPLARRTSLARLHRGAVPTDSATRLGAAALAGGEEEVWTTLTGHVAAAAGERT